MNQKSIFKDSSNKNLTHPKTNKGITLIALVITITVLLILAGVGIKAINDNNIIEKSAEATKEYNKQAATESINLKITTCQMNTYAEAQRMPTLKELAVELEKDDEIEYVMCAQKVASTQDINFTTATSIFTKLYAYPYKFEINSSLQLASIDGIPVASTPVNDDDTIVSMTKSELDNYITKAVQSCLETKNFDSLVNDVDNLKTNAETIYYKGNIETTGTVSTVNKSLASYTIPKDGTYVITFSSIWNNFYTELAPRYNFIDHTRDNASIDWVQDGDSSNYAGDTQTTTTTCVLNCKEGDVINLGVVQFTSKNKNVQGTYWITKL